MVNIYIYIYNICTMCVKKYNKMQCIIQYHSQKDNKTECDE